MTPAQRLHIEADKTDVTQPVCSELRVFLAIAIGTLDACRPEDARATRDALLDSANHIANLHRKAKPELYHR